MALSPSKQLIDDNFETCRGREQPCWTLDATRPTLHFRIGLAEIRKKQELAVRAASQLSTFRWAGLGWAGAGLGYAAGTQHAARLSLSAVGSRHLLSRSQTETSRKVT